MADKDFGVKKIELIGSSGTPNLTSPTNLNLNAATVAISTDVTIGGKVQSNILVGTGYSVGIGSTIPRGALDVTGSVYGDVSTAAAGKWVLGANGISDYTFTGPGLDGDEYDPVLYLARGRVYEFENTMNSHPFRIQSTPNGSTGTQYNTGVTNNDVSNGTLRFEIPMDAPNTLYYQCTSHTGMGGTISVYPNTI